MMGFSTLDYSIVAAYLAGITLFGAFLSRNQHTSVDYFLGGKSLSWWAVGFSIVASETSTLTVISVPGLAYKGNMHFLQLAIGYVIGRVIVSLLFIPAYYRGELETAYDFLGKRFGRTMRSTASTVFIGTRVLASGVRLFATAIPIHLITGLGYPASILIVGTCTLAYTFLGGLKAVVMTDVLQLFLYLTGSIASVLIILHRLPHGLADIVAAGTAGPDKFAIFNLSWGSSLYDYFASPYTLLGGLLGGTFLTMASHGTDQLLVQRLLGCKSRQESQRALLLDAGLILLQFAFFLFLGICLYAFYSGQSLEALGLRSADELFPKFIVEQLPSGIGGLVIAGVLASAMGSLSSSISSLASSSYLDLFRASSIGKKLTEGHELRWSRIFTLAWGGLLICGALLFTDTQSAVVELGLKIASFTYGGLLGTFFLGLFSRKATEQGSLVGFAAGLLAMTAVIYLTRIDYTWHTLIGSVVTVGVGLVFSRSRPGHEPVLSQPSAEG